MIKIFGFLIFFGALLIAFLGLTIMLMANEFLGNSRLLTTVTTWLVFVVGGMLIVYMIKRKGIG